MKKTILCSLPMRESTEPCIYSSSDQSLPTSNTPLFYPVNSFLATTLTNDDQVKVILLAKDGQYSHCRANIADFENELNSINRSIGASINYAAVITDFLQNEPTHKKMLDLVVSEIELNSHLIADITFGSKDVPIVIFTALTFAERQLGCDVDNILYGKADFVEGKPVNTELCDMSALYYLSSISSTVKCNDPTKAKKMLASLLSL